MDTPYQRQQRLTTQVNGNDHQHAAVDITFAPSGYVPTKGAQPVGLSATFSIRTFTAIDYEDSVDKVAMRDQWGQVLDYTFGEQQCSGSITLLLSEWFRVKDWAKNANPGYGIGQIAFDWAVNYGPSLNRIDTDTISGVRLGKEPRSSKNDQAALEITLPFVFVALNRANNPFIRFPGSPADSSP